MRTPKLDITQMVSRVATAWTVVNHCAQTYTYSHHKILLPIESYLGTQGSPFS